MRRNGARNNVNKSNHKKGIFSKKKKRNEKENENEWRGGGGNKQTKTVTTQKNVTSGARSLNERSGLLLEQTADV